MERQPEKIISEFNESLFQIQRINNDLVEAKFYRKKGHLKKYKFILETIEDELYYDAEKLDKERKEGSDTYVKKLNKVNRSIDFAIISHEMIKFYNYLREKERLLRRVQQECGKGAKYRGIDEDDWD